MDRTQAVDRQADISRSGGGADGAAVRTQVEVPAAGGVPEWVDDLDAALERLRDQGAAVSPTIETDEYGRFAWAEDPEGNRFELWEPAEGC